jgi:hypothetical protein
MSRNSERMLKSFSLKLAKIKLRFIESKASNQLNRTHFSKVIFMTVTVMLFLLKVNATMTFTFGKVLTRLLTKLAQLRL